MSLQLKNAKQLQLAAEAAKRREEEILRAKAEKQLQQLQDEDEDNTVERSTEADDEPSQSVEQPAVLEQEQMSSVTSVVQPTAADEDSLAKTASDEVSSSVADSEHVTAEVTREAVSDGDAEANQRLPETDHRETESETATEVPCSESSEKPENLENAADESAVVQEAVPVVVVAASDCEVVLTADVNTQSDASQSGSQSYMADDDKCISSDVETEQERPAELPVISEQLITDIDKSKLEIADDVLRSVSDESSDAYTDVLEDETDHLSDILEGHDKINRKEDIEYVELCDESSSTVEPNANKEDNKEETEKELDSILDDVHLDESEHGNCQ